MSEKERTERKGKCLSAIMRDGKSIAVVRCARLEECRSGIERVKPNKWECPGFIADEKAQAPDLGHTEGEKENA